MLCLCLSGHHLFILLSDSPGVWVMEQNLTSTGTMDIRCLVGPYMDSLPCQYSSLILLNCPLRTRVLWLASPSFSNPHSLPQALWELCGSVTASPEERSDEGPKVGETKANKFSPRIHSLL